ncbi:MAG: TolC family protein [Acidobacteriia bacterium]|nr:TolC family protein [Terriglobia bacterium]
MFEAHVTSAGALEDPSLMYRGWQVPLRQPWNYNAAQNMFMISQAFYGPGKRGLRTSVAEGDVAQAKAALDATKLDVRIRVRKAFYDLLRAEDDWNVSGRFQVLASDRADASREPVNDILLLPRELDFDYRAAAQRPPAF